MPVFNLKNLPNINNKLHNKMTKKDLYNSFLKPWLNKLNLNWVKPKFFHIFCWFHLFLAHNFKKQANKTNTNIYSLPFKNGKKDENNNTGKSPKV